MHAVEGMALLIGLYIGGVSGGLISAILIKIPGTPSSIATTFDGAPMAEKGEAGKALGVGIFYSFLGGTFSFLVLFFIPRPWRISPCASGRWSILPSPSSLSPSSRR
jgi:putative tricarboxylic transport membrane protein